MEDVKMIDNPMIKEQERADNENEKYSDWYGDNEDANKELYLEDFDEETLREWVLDENKETFFETFETGFIEFCENRYDDIQRWDDE